MPTSQKVTVRICDMPYTITTDEPESYLQELGKQIDARMRELMADNPRVSTNMAAVLTAITLADQAHKSEEAADNLRVKLRDYLAENESLQKQLEQATSPKVFSTPLLLSSRGTTTEFNTVWASAPV